MFTTAEPPDLPLYLIIIIVAISSLFFVILVSALAVVLTHVYRTPRTVPGDHHSHVVNISGTIPGYDVQHWLNKSRTPSRTPSVAETIGGASV